MGIDLRMLTDCHAMGVSLRRARAVATQSDAFFEKKGKERGEEMGVRDLADLPAYGCTSVGVGIWADLVSIYGIAALLHVALLQFLSASIILIIIFINARHIHDALSRLLQRPSTPRAYTLPNRIDDRGNSDQNCHPAELIQPIPSSDAPASPTTSAPSAAADVHASTADPVEPVPGRDGDEEFGEAE